MKQIITIKRLLNICCLLALFLVFPSSCVKDDLLDRTDPSAVDDAKAWTTPYLTKLGMNGVYAGLRTNIPTDAATTTSDREVYQFDQYGTSQTYSNQARRELLWGASSTSSSTFIEFWKDLYEGVYRACDAIVNIPVKSEADDALKTSYIAEAKFIRAFHYFRLNQVFRGVPIYDVPATMQDNKRPRSTEREVWNFIIQDLTDCINEPNLVAKYAADHPNYGKVTKGAAYALRGKAYMYIKEYQKAINDFEEVNKCGYSLFQGEFKALFKEANEQCDEMIFSIQNISLAGYGSSQHHHTGVRSAFGSATNSYGVATRTVDLFDNLDGSQFDWNQYIPGYNEMKPTDREVYFLRDLTNLRERLIAQGLTDQKKLDAAVNGITTRVQNRLKTFSSDAVRALYLSEGNEARIQKTYDTRDPRLKQSVITPYSNFLGALGNDENMVVMRWPYYSEEKGIGDLKSDDTSDLYYFHRKFVGEGTSEISVRSASPIDQPMIRYADVLLMKAEALAELDKLDEAVTVVNQVRKRAGVGLLNSSANTTVGSKAEVVNRIRKERKVEFVNEGLSYFDELRWGTWSNHFSADKYGVKAGRQWVFGATKREYVYDGDKTLVWPIPASEIEMNPALLPNNPGW